MGLDIVLYRGVSVHECDKIKPINTLKLYKDKSNTFYFAPESIEDEFKFERFEEHDFIIFDCPHCEEDKVFTLHPGYTCSVANGFNPGAIVQFQYVQRLYYGSYSMWHREVHLYGKIDFLKLFISDSDGYYSGPGLQYLRDRLAEAVNDAVGLRKYFELLENIPEEDLLTSTIVRHA